MRRPAPEGHPRTVATTKPAPETARAAHIRRDHLACTDANPGAPSTTADCRPRRRRRRRCRPRPPPTVALAPIAPPPPVAAGCVRHRRRRSPTAPPARRPRPGGPARHLRCRTGRSQPGQRGGHQECRRVRAPGDSTSFNVVAYAAGTPDDPSTARRLSLSRALAVRSALMADGVGSARIYVRALGAAGGDANARPGRPGGAGRQCTGSGRRRQEPTQQ